MTSGAIMTTDDKDSVLESPSQRAQRILDICNIVEDSKGRVTEATKSAIKELDVSREYQNVPQARQTIKFPRHRGLPTFVETSNEEGDDECAGDDLNSVAYLVRSTTELSNGQLEDNLRQCQLALIKVKENSHLKYTRLESEHHRMKDKHTAIQSKVDNMKMKVKGYLTERDEAKNKTFAIMETHQSVIDRTSEENQELQQELIKLQDCNENLTMQRDKCGEMLDNCTCREIEMDEMSETAFQKPQRRSSRLSFLSRKTSSSDSSRRSIFSRGSFRSSEIGTRRNSEYIDWDNDGYLY